MTHAIVTRRLRPRCSRGAIISEKPDNVHSTASLPGCRWDSYSNSNNISQAHCTCPDPVMSDSGPNSFCRSRRIGVSRDRWLGNIQRGAIRLLGPTASPGRPPAPVASGAALPNARREPRCRDHAAAGRPVRCASRRPHPSGAPARRSRPSIDSTPTAANGQPCRSRCSSFALRMASYALGRLLPIVPNSSGLAPVAQ